MVAGRKYLIIGGSQQATPTGTGSVWEMSLEVSGTPLSTYRIEKSAGQQASNLSALYTATATGNVTINFKASILTGSATLVTEITQLGVIPV